MTASTILFMIAPESADQTAPKRYQYVPASCSSHEIPAAIVQVETAYNAKVVGFVNREMLAEMTGIMDQFDQEGK